MMPMRLFHLVPIENRSKSLMECGGKPPLSACVEITRIFKPNPKRRHAAALHICVKPLVFWLFPLFFLQSARGQAARSHPGDGLPGRLEAYEPSGELAARMAAHSLTAGWFVREPLDPNKTPLRQRPKADRVPYLLYSPGPTESEEPVPLVLYFGGSWETGEDLNKHFNQPLIFEKVPSPWFQRDHPCYLFAPMPPDNDEFLHDTATLAVAVDAMPRPSCGNTCVVKK
jgi:hypothetical protein